MKKGIVQNIIEIIRNIIGAFFLLLGFCMIFQDFFIAFWVILFGLTILPIFYKKTKLISYPYLQAILPIIIFILYIIIGNIVITNDTSNDTPSNEATEEVEIIAVTDLHLSETNIELDVKESKDILLGITPENADTSGLNFNSTNSEVAKFKMNTEKSNSNEIYVNIQPISEGECELYINVNTIESNRIKVIVIDRERIENERIERERLEEEEKKAAEAQKQKELEESTKKQSSPSSSSSTKTTSDSKNSPSKSTTGSSSSKVNSNNSHGKAIYRTPTGKRYHFDPDCGGKNSYSTTLDSAISSGLTPCKKCAQ